MRLWLIAFLFLFATPIFANQKILNVYAWTNYIEPAVVARFEKQTGIKVNLTLYDNNETLYTKLKADPHIGYDIIIPSSYFVDRMRRERMLKKIDKAKLTNFKYLNPTFLNKKFDPHNQYSIPFLWGTTGIVVNSKFWNPKKITRWADLWQPRFKNQLLILDDPKEAFSIAMIALGYSINDTNPKHIHQAYLKLKQLAPNIKVFNSNAITNIYADADITVGMGWSGEIVSAIKTNPNLRYIYPKDGFAIWIDCLAIPKYAPHVKNAYQFINFLLSPKISALTSSTTYYNTPNKAALKLLPKNLQQSSLVNPPKVILQHGQYQLFIGKATLLYEHYWQLLKLSAGQ